MFDTSLDRRNFMKGAVLGAAAVGLASGTANADEAQPAKPSMQDREFGTYPEYPALAGNASDISRCASGACPDVTGKSLEERIQDVEDINALRNLKFAYWDSLDTRDFARMETIFADDAVFYYPDWDLEITGGKEVAHQVMCLLYEAIRSCHQGHQAYLEKTGPDTAQGTWVLRDDLYNTLTGAEFRGRGYYDEKYVKIDGRWYIQWMSLRYNMGTGEWATRTATTTAAPMMTVFGRDGVM